MSGLDLEGMVIRETIVVPIGKLNQEFEEPQNIRLRFDDSVLKEAFDIGALAFQKRRPTINGGGNKQDKFGRTRVSLPVPIDPNTMMLGRISFLDSLFESIVVDKKRESTTHNRLLKIVRVFASVDNCGFSRICESTEEARVAFAELTSHWLHQVKINQISSNNASTLQKALKDVIKLRFETKETVAITSNIRVIRHKKNKTMSAQEWEVTRSLGFMVELARTASSFILEGKRFPFEIDFKEYKSYVFPSQNHYVKTPYTKDNAVSAYNHKTGEFLTPDEYKARSKSPMKLYEAERAVRQAKENLDKVNANPRGPYFMKWAQYAMSAHMQLFITITGIYPIEIMQLEYSDDFQKERDLFKNDFRAIKFRARGKQVSYNLGSQHGMKLFKEYLEIRKWVVNGRDIKPLFFTITKNGAYEDNIVPFRHPSYIGSTYRQLHRNLLPNDLIRLSARASRKFKNVTMQTLGVTLDTASKVLSHTPKVNINHYSEINVDIQSQEMGNFWNAAFEAVKIIHPDRNSKRHSTETPSGDCSNSIRNPTKADESIQVEPKCETQYGCLFCKYYHLHADEVDVKKLMSMMYVIESVRDYFPDLKHSDDIFNSIFQRANELLDAIKKRSKKHKDIVDKVYVDVMKNGKLTDFWEHRMSRYERLGVI